MTVSRPRAGELLALKLFRETQVTLADLKGYPDLGPVQDKIKPRIFGDPYKGIPGLSSEACASIIAECKYLEMPPVEKGLLLGQQREQALFACPHLIWETIGVDPVHPNTVYLGDYAFLGNDLRLWNSAAYLLPVDHRYRKVAYWYDAEGNILVIYGPETEHVIRAKVGDKHTSPYVKEAERRMLLNMMPVPLDAVSLQPGPGPYQHD